jgi:hypothetical protein
MDTSGFYKQLEDGSWLFGETVRGAYGAWVLSRDNHTEFEYPYEGWTWFDEAPQEYLEWQIFTRILSDAEIGVEAEKLLWKWKGQIA